MQSSSNVVILPRQGAAGHPYLHRLAVKMTSLFDNLYFSRMKYRYETSALTEEHLQAILRISTMHIAIDFDALVKPKQFHRYIKHRCKYRPMFDQYRSGNKLKLPTSQPG